jgi:hypothetical protein
MNRKNIERKLKYHVCAVRALNMMDLVTYRNGRYVLDYLSFIRFSKYDFLRVRTVGRKTLEVIEELTETLKSIVGDSVSEEELQRRKEVLKYADMLFFNQKDTRVALFGYDVAIETAEIIVKDRDEYLKEGKLC